MLQDERDGDVVERPASALEIMRSDGRCCRERAVCTMGDGADEVEDRHFVSPLVAGGCPVRF
jgi:hypothetical protein